MDVATSADEVRRPGTLGQRLALLAEYLRLRHVADLSWAPGFARVLQRMDTLNQSWAQRFERHDSSDAWSASAQRPMSFLAGQFAATPPSDESATTGSAVNPETPHVQREQVLPVDVRSRLRAVAGAGADSMTVRLDAEADAEARSQRADAVTVGTTVKMRSGRFRPDTAEGLALLAHEASHVTALLSRGGTAHRNTPGGVEAEEAAAARVERLARQIPGEGAALPVEHGNARLPVEYGNAWPPVEYGGGVPPVGDTATALIDGRYPSPRGAAPMGAPASTTPLAAQPMRADVDRPEATAPAVPFDSDGLRHSIIEDLMRRLRTDSERGG
ncbi:DUF4157 domain-containing protein [Kribbella sp. NPDC049174]|uniref:eCIS core domain-containing protein n=1 Tax=Kribbella sp. NPDC049174 TaxID=3364112 RepID=UPI003724006F